MNSNTDTKQPIKPQSSVSQIMNDENKEIVTMRQLLECGVHFGHQTKRWNPKMKPYIFTSRNGIHVIDLQQSIRLIKEAYDYIRSIVEKRGTVLFIGTKKQAQTAIKESACLSSMPYVNHRWLGGTLTNHITINKSINRLHEFDKMKEDGTLDKLSKKEGARLSKRYNRLNYYLEGLKDFRGLPQAVFIVDTKKEQLAINEANRLEIPIIAVVDTNADPTLIQYPIPANDDAIRAIKLICTIMSQAVLDGQERQISLEPETADTTAEEAKAEDPKKAEAPKVETANLVSKEVK